MVWREAATSHGGIEARGCAAEDAVILEEQMTSMGLSEEEKNAKTAELVAFVSEAVSEKLAPRARRPRQLHCAALQA